MKKIPGKFQSKETQEYFIRKIDGIYKQAQLWKCILLFSDAMHQIHNSEVGYAWQERWRIHTKILLSNTGRARLNITGAYNPITTEAITQIEETNCNIDSTKRFLTLLRTSYPGTGTSTHPNRTIPILLILDNARYQKAYEVQEYAKTLNIQLHYLPAYSPNLNLIERFWKYTKKVLVRNQYYETFTEFIWAFESFFSLLKIPDNRHQYELQSLLTMKFEVIMNY